MPDDRHLITWKKIESVAPYKPGVLRRKYGSWLIANGYVVKDWVNGHFVCWSWESLIKAGIIRLLTEKNKKRMIKNKKTL